MTKWPVLLTTLGVFTFAAYTPAAPQDAAPVDAVAALPNALRGPFISDPAVIARLDHLDPGGDCAKSGKLVFACLIQTLAEKNQQEAPAALSQIPSI